jgi:hypothetical protein
MDDTFPNYNDLLLQAIGAGNHPFRIYNKFRFYMTSKTWNTNTSSGRDTHKIHNLMMDQ